MLYVCFVFDRRLLDVCSMFVWSCKLGITDLANWILSTSGKFAYDIFGFRVENPCVSDVGADRQTSRQARPIRCLHSSTAVISIA